MLYHEPIACGAYLPAGWITLVKELSEELEPMFAEFDKASRPVVQQIKEKFASGRYYVNHSTQEIRDTIARWEERCGKTCQTCGAPGTPRMVSNYLLATVCDECAKTKS